MLIFPLEFLLRPRKLFLFANDTHTLVILA